MKLIILTVLMYSSPVCTVCTQRPCVQTVFSIAAWTLYVQYSPFGQSMDRHFYTMFGSIVFLTTTKYDGKTLFNVDTDTIVFSV